MEEFSALFLFAHTFEFRPLLSVPAKAQQDTWLKLLEHKDKLPVDFDQAQFTDPYLLNKFYSAQFLQDWLNEVSEQEVLERYNLRPGLLHAKIQRVDWLCYASIELSKVLGLPAQVSLLERVRARLKYGCKEELLELVQLKGIGRVRARKLFNAHISSIARVKKTELADLTILLGKETALKVKKQLQQVSASIPKSVPINPQSKL